MQIIKAARGRITGHFGDQNVPGANVKRHLGIDIGHGDSTFEDLRVGAPAAGRIIRAATSGTYGQHIIIDHGLGYSSLLAHLALFSFEDYNVGQGELLGVMGHTGGDWPVHVHQELRYLGVPVDPERHLVAASAPASTTTAALTDTTENEDDDMGFYITESADAPKFWLSQTTGRKRSIRKAEWAALRASEKVGGPPLVVVIMTKANLAAIPGT